MRADVAIVRGRAEGAAAQERGARATGWTGVVRGARRVEETVGLRGLMLRGFLRMRKGLAGG
ncbi:MAG: hypothetical protein ACUVV6_05750 [Thermoplasmatota archaeon]